MVSATEKDRRTVWYPSIDGRGPRRQEEGAVPHEGRAGRSRRWVARKGPAFIVGGNADDRTVRACAEVAPGDPNGPRSHPPSLQNPEEIHDPAITARAIARKRGGYGNAMADILLPEGRTVEQLVREAVATAVQEKGYAVVNEQSPAFARALPLAVDIQQFWSWATPGFWQVSAEFEGILLLKSEALLVSPQEAVRGYGIVKGMAITDDVWQQVMQQGIADLVAQVKAKVRNPAGGL